MKTCEVTSSDECEFSHHESSQLFYSFIFSVWCYPQSGCLHQIDKNACYHSKLDLNFKQLLPAHRPQFVTPLLQRLGDKLSHMDNIKFYPDSSFLSCYAKLIGKEL